MDGRFLTIEHLVLPWGMASDPQKKFEADQYNTHAQTKHNNCE